MNDYIVLDEREEQIRDGVKAYTLIVQDSDGKVRCITHDDMGEETVREVA